MPIRQGGTLASRASTWPRDHFCRSTMAPRASWPTTWNAFLPISMPITAIAVLGVRDMACSLSLAPLASFPCWRGRSTAGPSHYRTHGHVRFSPAIGEQADINSASSDRLGLLGIAVHPASLIRLAGNFHDP